MRPSWTGRRQAERRECSIKATAQFYDGSPAIECIITDYSAAGARVIFPDDREPPGAFDLFVPSRGDTRHAKLRWRTPDAIGVEFVQGKPTTEDTRLSELLVRVSQLEEELRAMRASVALAKATAGEMPQIEAPRVVIEEDHERAAKARDDHKALAARVATLETRNDEMLGALKQTLGLLSELRDATAPQAKAS